MAEGLAAIPGVELANPVQTNAVFARLSADAREALSQRYAFGVWDGGLARFMAAWDTTPQHVDAFVAAVAQAVRGVMERLLVGLARAAGRRRWRFVIVWAALLAVALPFTGQVGGRSRTAASTCPDRSR